MNFSKSQLIIIGIGAFIFISIIVIIVLGWGKRDVIEKAELTFWGTDSSEYFSDAIAGFQKKYKGLTVKYRQIDEPAYEDQLVDSLAAGNGPDVLMFGSRWLPRHQNKIFAAPVDTLSANRFSDLFPSVASNDFVSEGVVYAAPLYIDTLALYYNRSIFDRLAISLPPRTWDDFKGLIAVRKATASFGGYAPLVTRASDIINALLMQAGGDLDLKNKGFVRLSSEAGIKALNFYIQFTAPKEDSITGFAGERLSMMLGYHSDKELIKKKNPFIDLGVTSLPQFYVDSPVVPARYYGAAVSVKSDHKEAAWEFINYLTTDTAVAEVFAEKNVHPPALRSVIQEYSDDSELGVFARQALIARSWFEPDDRKVTEIFNTMIRSAISARSSQAALQSAESEINKLINQ